MTDITNINGVSKLTKLYTEDLIEYDARGYPEYYIRRHKYKIKLDDEDSTSDNNTSTNANINDNYQLITDSYKVPFTEWALHQEQYRLILLAYLDCIKTNVVRDICNKYFTPARKIREESHRDIIKSCLTELSESDAKNIYNNYINGILYVE